VFVGLGPQTIWGMPLCGLDEGAEGRFGSDSAITGRCEPVPKGGNGPKPDGHLRAGKRGSGLFGQSTPGGSLPTNHRRRVKA
jgi:hypothetical protein